MRLDGLDTRACRRSKGGIAMHPLPMLEKSAMPICIPESPFVRARLVNASYAEAAAVPERKLTCTPDTHPEHPQ